MCGWFFIVVKSPLPGGCVPRSNPLPRPYVCRHADAGERQACETCCKVMEIRSNRGYKPSGKSKSPPEKTYISTNFRYNRSIGPSPPAPVFRTRTAAEAHRGFPVGAQRVARLRSVPGFPSTWKYFSEYLEIIFQVLGSSARLRHRRSGCAPRAAGRCGGGGKAARCCRDGFAPRRGNGRAMRARRACRGGRAPPATASRFCCCRWRRARRRAAGGGSCGARRPAPPARR